MLHTHHLHVRKRSQNKHEPFPARTPFKRALDNTVFVLSFVAPATFIPQIVQIYSTQDASDISVFTFGTLCLLHIPWLLYGIVHREVPIITVHVLMGIMNATVLAGALLYG